MSDDITAPSVLDGWVEKSRREALATLQRTMELSNVAMMYEMSSEEIAGSLAAYLDDLKNIFLMDYTNAILLDNSDIIMGAKGPGIEFGTAPMFVFSYMLDSSRRQINSIVKTMNKSRSKIIPQEFEPEVIGFAPGSIYLGLAAPDLENTERLFGKSDPIIQDVKFALDTLAYASSVVSSEKSVDQLAYIVKDPATRDATLQAIAKIAPSQRNIIKEISIIGVTQDEPLSSNLTQKERRIARDISNRPREDATYNARLLGTVREVDLDQRRFELRKVEGLDSTLSVRCVYEQRMSSEVKRLLDRKVFVSGLAENDVDGDPRIIYVEGIELHTNQQPLDFT